MQEKYDALHNIYRFTDFNFELSSGLVFLRTLILFLIEWAALLSRKPWTLIFLIIIVFFGTAYLYYELLLLDYNMYGIWLYPSMQTILILIPIKYIHTENIYGPPNIWFALSFISVCIILLQYSFLKIYRYTGKIDMIPILVLIIEMALMLLILRFHYTNFLLIMSLLVFIFEINRYCYPDFYAWKKQDRLFFDTLLFPRVHYISESFLAYVGRPLCTVIIPGYLSPKEKEFRKLTCPERKEIVKKELRNLCSRFKPGRIYITETHMGVIHYIHKQQDDEFQIKTISCIKAPLKSKTHSAFRKIYGDKWKYCDKCPLYPNKEECTMTDNYSLPERISRDAYVWIFIRTN